VSISGAEEITRVAVVEANVDRGYSGHDYKGTAVIRIAGTSNKGLSLLEKRRKRRRSSVEPVIGHLKSDHRLDRCFLKGRIGDKLNLIGSASGYNMLKLLRLMGRGIFSCALFVFRRFWCLASRFLDGTRGFFHTSVGGA
jgi:IS5 family transposase